MKHLSGTYKQNETRLQYNNYLQPSFKAKIPKKPVEGISEDALKIASVAIAATGIAGITMTSSKNPADSISETQLAEFRMMAKDNLMPLITKEKYIVIRDNFLNDEKGLDSYLEYSIKKVLLDYKKYTSAQINLLKSLMKEIILERINDESKPNDFSDIEIVKTKFSYRQILLTKNICEFFVNNHITQPQVMELTGCSHKTVAKAYKENGVKSIREKLDSQANDDEFIQKLVKLYDEGMSTTEIGAKVGRTSDTVVKLLNRGGRRTERQDKPHNERTSEYIEEVIRMAKAGKSAREISNTLGGCYIVVLDILRENGVETPRQSMQRKAKNPKIIKQVIQMGIDNFSARKIAKELDITEAAVLKILFFAGIKTKRQKDLEKVQDEVFIQKIINLANDGVSAITIASQLGCADKTVLRILEQSGVKTIHKVHKDRGKDPNFISKVIELGEKGESSITIANKLGGTWTQVLRILNDNGIKTDRQVINETADFAYKDKINDLIKLKYTPDEIIEKLNISEVKYARIVKRYNLEDINLSEFKTPKKSYEDYSIKELKNKFVELILDDNISDNLILSDCLDFLCDSDIFIAAQKNVVIDFIKTLDDFANKKITKEQAEEAEAIGIISDRIAELEKEEQSNNNLLISFNETLDFLAHNEPELYNICVKYLPNYSQDNFVNYGNIQFIMNMMDDFASNKDEIIKQLVYWDSKNNQNKILKNAEIYAKDNNGNIDKIKAGEYILSVQKFNNSLNDISDENHRVYAEIIDKMLVQDEKNRYVEACKILDIYDNISEKFKPVLINQAQKWTQYNDHIFTDKMLQFAEREKFCDIENYSKFSTYNHQGAYMGDLLITPKAKQECWDYCNGDFDKFYDFMKMFYEVATITVRSAEGAAGVKDLKRTKKEVLAELKINGRHGIGNMRIFGLKKTKKDYDTNNELLNKYGNVKYVFDLFGDHNILDKFN